MGYWKDYYVFTQICSKGNERGAQSKNKAADEKTTSTYLHEYALKEMLEQ